MIANHFKVSLESKPTIENLVYTVSLRFGCYAPDLIEPITATLYPLESRDRHGGPPLVGVSYSYCQTWKYIPPFRGV